MSHQNINRRKALKYSLQSSAATVIGTMLPFANNAQQQAPAIIQHKNKSGKIAVVGAGAFGGWAALHLLRKGYDVTLIDQFGPGNIQASSGGETRLIRAFYGGQQVYFNLVRRSLEIWKENEPLMSKKILHQTGLLVFVPAEKDAEVEAAIPLYQKAGLPFEKFSPDEAAKRWPQINVSDLNHIMLDASGGYLLARDGCMQVCNLFVKEGGKFIQQNAASPTLQSGKCSYIVLSDGTTIEADTFLFAGGPWLVRLFPGITKKFKITRQVVFFFASPSNSSDFMENHLPTWFNKRKDGVVDLYGLAGNEYRGFKAASEYTHDITDIFDNYNRYYTDEDLNIVKKIMYARFPKMKDRPIIEANVCQYTETPDSNYVLDKHPEADNVWIMGAGNGHGYKMGASFGEVAAKAIAGEEPPHEMFAVKRLL